MYPRQSFRPFASSGFVMCFAWVDPQARKSRSKKITGWFEKKWFGGWDEMHKIAAQPARREDDALFLYASLRIRSNLHALSVRLNEFVGSRFS